MVGRAFSVMVLVWLLAACAGPEPQVVIRREIVRVEVPVPVRPEIPPELAGGLVMQRPEFVAPQHPQASSALTAEGEVALKLLLLELKTRDEQWRQVYLSAEPVAAPAKK